MTRQLISKMLRRVDANQPLDDQMSVLHEIFQILLTEGWNVQEARLVIHSLALSQKRPLSIKLIDLLYETSPSADKVYFLTRSH